MGVDFVAVVDEQSKTPHLFFAKYVVGPQLQWPEPKALETTIVNSGVEVETQYSWGVMVFLIV